MCVREREREMSCEKMKEYYTEQQYIPYNTCKYYI